VLRGQVVKHSVVIATYNRAGDLRDTLVSLSQLSTSSRWEVLVVDNNSTDDTRAVVEELASSYPTALKYLLEKEQGRSAALNTGFRAAEGDIILTTDDDVRVEPDWLVRAVSALNRFECAYVGGAVLPIWMGPRPWWLRDRSGPHWIPIALMDLGPTAVEFVNRAPLGVNMAFRRDTLAVAGFLDNALGRKAGTLLGQEVREWCMRVRAAGMRGMYIPEMIVHHKIPVNRLNMRYFCRSFYWRGVSRAIFYRIARVDMEAPEDSTLDFARVPHVAGVPRYLYRKVLSEVSRVARGLARRDSELVLDSAMQLCFYAGILVETWKGLAQKLLASAYGRVNLIRHEPSARSR
jgi:glycosyltransferase involved in cell wall biosynthesis